jgi:hypothetical protein
MNVVVFTFDQEALWNGDVYSAPTVSGEIFE